MANATVSRPGQINAAGSATALFLKVWSGEVLTAFAETNVMMDKHIVRNINHGISAQFPATWKQQAEYHTVGTEIVGNVVNHNERVITIDDLLISHAFIASIDEAMNHYDFRGIYSEECGRALSYEADKHLLQVVALAARASTNHNLPSNPPADGFGGTTLTNASFVTDGSVLASGIYDSAQAFDEKDVPAMDRYFICRPAQYYLMVQTTDLINTDWNGAGSFSQGNIAMVAGIPIFKSNHIPNTNITTGPSAYQGDFTNTVAVCFHRSAVGTVKLLDMRTEMAYDIRRQGTLIVSKYAMGHGILRPESAIELKSA